MKKLWNWIRDETDQRVLRLEGAIAEESWFEEDVTPQLFKADLMAGSGPITVWINSPGGDCIAASQIYNMLMDYRRRPSAASAGASRTAHSAPQTRNTGCYADGAETDVTVKVDGVAASAASVIAMAGSRVCMSPTSLMMIHNPLTVAMGDSAEMRKAIQLLDEVKESIINAYEIKTSLPREQLSSLMDAETWMNANKARELGFCDEILFTDEQQAQPHEGFFTDSFSFSRKTASACLLNKLKAHIPQPDNRVKAADLEKRLSLLKLCARHGQQLGGERPLRAR